MDKVIFLDRDGVINKDPGYIKDPDEFEFLPGSLEALKKLNAAEYQIIVISNQAGISKGLYTEEDLRRVNEKMFYETERAGAKIRSAHYCIHGEEDNCSCRKPKTGLLQQATEGMKVNFKETFFIGDKETDIEAGKNIGCQTVLVLTGKLKEKDIPSLEVKPDYIKRDLKEAVNWILEN
jgi:histidinol-phosphate phosphatase family protein